MGNWKIVNIGFIPKVHVIPLKVFMDLDPGLPHVT